MFLFFWGAASTVDVSTIRDSAVNVVAKMFFNFQEQVTLLI